jgi:hypothetical protein
MIKKISPILGIIVLLAIALPLIFYVIGYIVNNYPEEFSFSLEEKETKMDIRDFYLEDYPLIFAEESSYDCHIKMGVSSERKEITLNTQCEITPPYSALEAFYAVARGILEKEGVSYYTYLDKSADEEEAFEKKLGTLSYPTVASNVPSEEHSEEEILEGEGNLCVVPCVGGEIPKSTEVLDVSYQPGVKELEELFQDYKWANFKDLTLVSEYAFKAIYESMEGKIEWRYLMGQHYSGAFEMELVLDKPATTVECLREESDLIGEAPDFDCSVEKENDYLYRIKGFASGLDKLTIIW